MFSELEQPLCHSCSLHWGNINLWTMINSDWIFSWRANSSTFSLSKSWCQRANRNDESKRWGCRNSFPCPWTPTNGFTDTNTGLGCSEDQSSTKLESQKSCYNGGCKQNPDENQIGHYCGWAETTGINSTVFILVGCQKREDRWKALHCESLFVCFI